MKNEIISPGSWLGVLGGGQLGRMFAQSAHRQGYRVAVFESDTNCPAAQVSNRFFDASQEVAKQNVLELAKLCEVVTLEFENIEAELVDLAAEHCATCPGADFLRMAQNRVLEKTSLSEAGFPTTPFLPAATLQEAEQAATKLGYPVVLKTATSGYDGKGQAKVASPDHMADAWQQLQCDDVIVEKMIDFVAEASMLTARNLRGEIVGYPLFENAHANHILDVTTCPASEQINALSEQARRICRGIAEQYEVVGIFCVEFFVTSEGGLLINEIAPRPHNSGHLTIESFDVSQFDLQVRSICNLPLQEPKQIKPAAMANLLGNVWGSSHPHWQAAFTKSNSFLHLYGKPEARVARKMGHLTCLADHSGIAEEQARMIRSEMTAD